MNRDNLQSLLLFVMGTALVVGIPQFLKVCAERDQLQKEVDVNMWLAAEYYKVQRKAQVSEAEYKAYKQGFEELLTLSYRHRPTGPEVEFYNEQLIRILQSVHMPEIMPSTQYKFIEPHTSNEPDMLLPEFHETPHGLSSGSWEGRINAIEDAPQQGRHIAHEVVNAAPLRVIAQDNRQRFKQYQADPIHDWYMKTVNDVLDHARPVAIYHKNSLQAITYQPDVLTALERCLQTRNEYVVGHYPDLIKDGTITLTTDMGFPKFVNQTDTYNPNFKS